MLRRPPRPTPFPYTTLFRSLERRRDAPARAGEQDVARDGARARRRARGEPRTAGPDADRTQDLHPHQQHEPDPARRLAGARSEEHTSELQSLAYLVCRLLLE